MMTHLNDRISPEAQQDWLNDVHFLISEDFPPQDGVENETQKAAVEQLGTLPKSKQLAEILEIYLKTGLPAPRTTAGMFWSCVVLPENSEHDNPIYIRLYAGAIEVLTVYLDPMRSTLNFSFHVSAAPIKARSIWKKFQHRFRFTSMRLTDHRYEKGGADQQHFALSNVGETRNLLKETTFLKAIRSLNLRLMQQEKASHRDEHNDWLVNQILANQ